ncbi:MAG: septum formation initiator family protein [Elusimicrobia bacterium]|nr:septum formation initiator family protein [Elusimicrobiota bacterium]
MLNSVNKKKMYLFIGIFLLILVMFGNKGMYNVIKQRIELTRLNKEFIEIENENRDLRKQLYGLENNPANIEREARNRLGLIQPGEIKYKFIEKE